MVRFSSNWDLFFFNTQQWRLRLNLLYFNFLMPLSRSVLASLSPLNSTSVASFFLSIRSSSRIHLGFNLQHDSVDSLRVSLLKLFHNHPLVLLIRLQPSISDR
ncbi:hypothetical protein RYX36_009537 [Vicia faba]